MGHEASGIIVSVGKDVRHLKEGDAVVIDPGQSCGQCMWCQTGRYNLCDQAAWDFLGTAKKDGAMQQYVKHPAGRVYRLPDNTSLITGALLEPYSVAAHGIRRLQMSGGGFTVVQGCGCIGLMTIYSLRRRYHTKIIAIDVVDKRLEKAQAFGADFTINSAVCSPAEKVLEITGNVGADYVFETAGVPATVSLTADLARKGGRIVFVGTTVDSHVSMHYNAIMRKELDLTSVFRYAGELRLAVDELWQTPFSLDDVVSHKYPFDQIQEAFELNLKHKNEVIKTIIQFD